jgi:uncharacterized membrane protein
MNPCAVMDAPFLLNIRRANRELGVLHALLRVLAALSIWAYLAQPSWAQQKSSTSTCMVSEFKMIALRTGDPAGREENAKKWLLNTGPTCSLAQLKVIQSSAPSWLGASLSNELSILMESLQEAKLSGDSAKLSELFEPAIKTFEPSTVKTANPPARAPVVANPGGGVVMMGGVPIVRDPNAEFRPPINPGRP